MFRVFHAIRKEGKEGSDGKVRRLLLIELEETHITNKVRLAPHFPLTRFGWSSSLNDGFRLERIRFF